MAKLIEIRRAKSHFGNLPGNGIIEHCSMSSDILGVNKEFSVYLPNGYYESDQRYPVAYFLHPAGGTHEIWISMGELPQIADDAIRSGMAIPMIIVMADGSGEAEYHLGKHLGFFSVEGWDYEAYFHKELIPLVDSTFRTFTERKFRAIVGASMGGEASIAYAQKHPDIYGASCAMSGIVGHPEQSQMAQSDKGYAASLIENNPSAFVENATPDNVEKLKTVRWYTDCGDNDFFYERNVEFFLEMKKKGIPIDYRMRSGVHGWYYWVTGMAPILTFLSTGFIYLK